MPRYSYQPAGVGRHPSVGGVSSLSFPGGLGALGALVLPASRCTDSGLQLQEQLSQGEAIDAVVTNFSVKPALSF